MAGNNNKYIETVKQNEKFINNPVFKLLPIINAISSFVQSDEKNFEDFFIVFNSKDKRVEEGKKDNENNNISLIGNKRHQEKSISPPPMITMKTNQSNNIETKKEEKIEENNPKDELVNKLMELSKFSREEVVKALYGTDRKSTVR